MKHKLACWVTSLLLIIGGLNLGLVGVGNFLDKNLNVLNLLLGSIPVLENIVYVLVGLAALAMLVVFFIHSKNCGCHKCCDEKCCEEKKEATMPEAEMPKEEEKEEPAAPEAPEMPKEEETE